MVNKRVQNAVLGCNLKNERMISVHFQGKPFNTIVIQVYAPTNKTNNPEEAEVEWFYEDLQNLLELTPKKEVLFHYRGLEWVNLIQMTIISTSADKIPQKKWSSHHGQQKSP